MRRARAHAGLVVVIIHAGAEGAQATHTPDGDEYYLGELAGLRRANRDIAHGLVQAFPRGGPASSTCLAQ